ncbi:MT-A70 family methyltransferase [Allomesorhizobium alhagi]|uniref:MT-A70 family protein n=1 Tax=Mesorhizobium alhagi CCNWXJ12-2 TaxID=1107882 RepID=H0HQW7_9HYPH|nr:MT-A70 family methyltransferase [Mesorhizobium alhagi]EHK56931.1 MT-A70 family protein [Mesorhizobium alhagi CCNWXJ12-2]
MKYQLLPPLSAEEYASLEASIIAHGVLVPVEYDEDGEILDGHHRVAICESLGLVDWPRFVRKGLSETDKRKLARELNVSRRHLTTAQKQAVIADQLRDTPSISSRAIAGMLGVHHSTVETVRKRMVDGGEISHHEEVEGRDGVKQPARKTIKTSFMPDADNRRELMKVAKGLRAEQQKLRHTVRIATMQLTAERGKATSRVWWKDGEAGPTYPVIYADPPHKFLVHSEVTGREKSAENHYPTMDLQAILDLGCPAGKDGVLFLWVTDLANGLRIMEAWGFTFKSFWGWKKVYPGEQLGTGYWSFDNLELLLIGTRGDVPAPLPGTQPQKCTEHPVAAHSAKPDWYAEQIERLYPGVPKLEMFCRSPRPGWDHWGFEAGEESERGVTREDKPQLSGECPEAPPVEEAPAVAVDSAAESQGTASASSSVTADELAEFKALGAIGAGVTVKGPLIDSLNERGLIWAGKELTVGGAQRLAELGRMVEAASDGDAVNLAPIADAADVPTKKRGRPSKAVPA